MPPLSPTDDNDALPADGQNKPDLLKYNPAWIDRTFSKRSLSEMMMRPQLEAGVISANDYNAFLDLTDNWHTRYPIIGAALGMTTGYRFRPPRLTRTTGVFLGLLAGYTFGTGFEVMAHINLLSRLENPEGFKTALQNIAKDLEDPQQRGLMIARTIQNLQKRDADGLDSDVPAPVYDTGPAHAQEIPTPRSKWDEIRQANAGQSKQSAWDSVRKEGNSSKGGSFDKDEN